MLKKPSLGRNSQKMFVDSFFSKNINLNSQIYNNDNDNIFNNNNANNSNKNNSNTNLGKLIKKESNNNNNSKPSMKKAFKRLKSTKFAFKNSEERNNQDFRIIKEIFDQEKYFVSEEELFRRGEGYCFGEWALIYREPRSASIYTLEDCVFFTLDEIHFRNSFLKSLNNSEYNKKKFALQNFLPFDMMDERQLSIYKNIVPITCSRNQVIFKEGDKSDSIYLIYCGSFTLEKKYVGKKFRVLNLEKGSIVGLESIFEGENSKFKCSLVLSNGLDVGLIFQLKINKLRPYIINKMKISFKTNYNVFLKSWNELYNKNVFIQQKIYKENKGDIFGEQNQNENLNLDNDNNELNNDLLNKNWDSVLNIKPEDKYEELFKDCLKQRAYKNYKKDGSLRIFSSRQKNKIYEHQDNNNKDNDNNNNNSNKVNIIKYFKNNSKIDINNNNSKTANSCKNRKKKNLNIEISEKTKNNKSLETFRNKLNLTDKKSNTILIDNEEKKEEKNKIFQKSDTKRKIKNNYIINQKPLKLNKNLLFETNNSKGINQRNKYVTIHFKNSNPIINNNKYLTKQEISIIKKLAQERMDKKEKDIIFNNIININEIKNKKYFNNNLNYINKKHNLKLREHKRNNKNKHSRNYTFFQNNKNSSLEKNSFYNNNINNPISIQNQNEKNNLYHKFYSTNSAKINKNKKLIFNDDIYPEGNLKKNKYLLESESAKNLSLSNSKCFILDKKNLSPMNLNKNNIFNTFDRDNNMLFEIQSSKNLKHNIFGNSKLYNIFKNNNLTQRNRKNKNNLFIEENKTILQQMDVNNGFSYPYFEKINPIDNINLLPISNKNKPFPSYTNLFKVSFDSGDFKIPLISSSIKLKKL